MPSVQLLRPVFSTLFADFSFLFPPSWRQVSSPPCPSKQTLIQSAFCLFEICFSHHCPLPFRRPGLAMQPRLQKVLPFFLSHSSAGTISMHQYTQLKISYYKVMSLECLKKKTMRYASTFIHRWEDIRISPTPMNKVLGSHANFTQ